MGSRQKQFSDHPLTSDQNRGVQENKPDSEGPRPYPCCIVFGFDPHSECRFCCPQALLLGLYHVIVAFHMRTENINFLRATPPDIKKWMNIDELKVD